MPSYSSPFDVGEVLDRAVVEVHARLVGRGDDELAGGAGSHDGLGAAEVRVVRAHVDGRPLVGEEAARGDAGDDRVVAVLGVVLAVDVALEQLGVADDGQHLILLDELGGGGGEHRRVGSDVLVRVLDRVAVDAAVGVDALEVDGGHLRDPREVDAGDVGGRAAELDRIAGRLFAGVEPALAGLDDHRARAGSAGSRCPPSARVAVGSVPSVGSVASVAGGSVASGAAVASVASVADGASVAAGSSSSSPQAATTNDAAASTATNRRSFSGVSPL